MISIFHRSSRNPNIHQCLICHKYHSLRYCKKFLAMNVFHRRQAVRRYGYCLNCLARSHKTMRCTSTELCQKCGNDHHTLLHAPIHRRLQQQDANRNQNASSRQHFNNRISNQRRPRVDRESNPINNTNAVIHPRQCLKIALKALERLQQSL